MSTTVKTWYDFVLQQMAAESYLDGWKDLSNTDRQNRLLLGSNNIYFLQAGETPTTPVLNGATRMTATQAADFTSRYTIVDHRSNDDPRFANTDGVITEIGDGTGFSATLMLDNQTGEYTLSMRSTEYFNQSAGGDWARDGLDGADGEINSYGYALGQMVAMEDYYNYLKTTKLLPVGATLNVTGYSLSGSLATVFTELHSSEVAHTYAFNSPGHGTFDITQGSLVDVIAYFRKALVDALTADAGTMPAGLWHPLSTTNVYLDPRYLNALEATKQHFSLVGNSLSGYYNNLFGDGPVVANPQITQIVGVGSNGDTALVANAQTHPAPTNIFIEDQPDIQGFGPLSWADQILGIKSDYGTTHSITLLADSLAVMSVFEKLGLDMSNKAGLDKVYNILAAGSNQSASYGMRGKAEGDSLEKAVEALGKLMLGDAGLASVLNLNGRTNIPYNRAGGGFSNLGNRAKFYDVLDAVNAAGNCYRHVHVRDLSAIPTAQIASEAQANIAYRYALSHSTRSPLVGNDDVYAQHNPHKRTRPLRPRHRQGQLTTDYLTDRAGHVGLHDPAQHRGQQPISPADILYHDAAQQHHAESRQHP